MIITYDDTIQAVNRLKPGKFDGLHMLSSNHFLPAGDTLYVHLALLFTAMIIHGTVPRDFMISSILPTPKN